MSRTNIDIDDDLIAEIISTYRLRTKREAVDFALRRLVRPKLAPDEILALQGIGWEGDLEAIKTSRRFDDFGRNERSA
ncbi:MAG: type II toxin-antitoxin system VapB family antitoxin [Jatrophihabitans sp.]